MVVFAAADDGRGTRSNVGGVEVAGGFVGGGVMKIGYFGNYLWYLPTNPMSGYCDNISANPSWMIESLDII